MRSMLEFLFPILIGFCIISTFNAISTDNPARKYVLKKLDLQQTTQTIVENLLNHSEDPCTSNPLPVDHHQESVASSKSRTTPSNLNPDFFTRTLYLHESKLKRVKLNQKQIIYLSIKQNYIYIYMTASLSMNNIFSC